MPDNQMRARTLLNLLIARKTTWNEDQLWTALNHIRCLLAETESATERPAIADLWHDAETEQPPLKTRLLVYALARHSVMDDPVPTLLVGQVLWHEGLRERFFIGASKIIWMNEKESERLLLWQEIALPIPVEEGANETVAGQDRNDDN